ncbi:MAG: HU family DNA-binding protein [Ruminiclostridium sp.]|jgi:DNA-binding protein HU-beta|nr:HU family DNA-binding protein [Ruminiclostridium sp.]
MTKSELIASIATKTGLTKKTAEEVLEAFIGTVSESLSKGEKVQLVGFGTFEVRERSERSGINPQTREKITIAATKTPAFKAGSALKEAVAE